MREIRTGLLKTTKIKLYESIKELPIERNHELMKLVLQDLGIGSTIDDAVKHFSVFHNLLANNKIEEARQEAKNLHNNIFYIMEGINIKSFCFLAMVAEINGKKIKDFSMEGVQKEVKRLSDSGLKQGQVDDIVEEVKKNLIRSYEPIFLTDMEIQD